MGFLDNAGLGVVWGKIKERLDGKLGAKTANGYVGMTKPDGTDQDYIRTTNSGIIPYKSGGASVLGTTMWPFSSVTTNKLQASSPVGPTYDTTISTVMPTSASAYLQSPVSPFLWHDLFAFCYVATPTFSTSVNGSAWTSSNVDKRLFNQMENQTIPILTSDIVGARWVWNSSSFNYSSGGWLILGITYTYPQCKYDILFEQSTDGAEWTAIHSSENLSYNQQPIWCRAANTGTSTYLRLTISKHDISDSGTLNLACIRFLSSRWGNQGQGSEISKPYCWDSDRNVFPWIDNANSLGLSGKRWKNVYATTFTENGTSLSDKYLGKTAKAASATTADTAMSVAWENTNHPTFATVATSGSYNDLSNKPTIPSAVTESTVSGWGFTKNSGTYSKPSTGIPKTDLASAVQTSLGKADTALQAASPALTGTPTAPTASAGTNTTQIATTAFVTTAVANAIEPTTEKWSSPTWQGNWTGSAACRKNGKVVSLAMSGVRCTTATTLNTTSPTGNLLFTIPDGYRPSGNTYGFIGGSGTSMQAVVQVQSSTGNVYLAYPNSSTAPTSGGFYGSVTWVRE